MVRSRAIRPRESAAFSALRRMLTSSLPASSQTLQSPFYTTMVFAWSCAEIIRNTHYILTLLKLKSSALEWIRCVASHHRQRFRTLTMLLAASVAQVHGVLCALPSWRRVRSCDALPVCAVRSSISPRRHPAPVFELTYATCNSYSFAHVRYGEWAFYATLALVCIWPPGMSHACLPALAHSDAERPADR